METDTDGDADPGDAHGLTQGELYTVLRTAITDALLDVLGTVFLLAIALLFVVTGVYGLLVGPSRTGVVVGTVFVALGAAIAAVALDYVPPFSE
ncbi:hypothetical protein [Natrinema versiforme]|uniref:Uncharacterized protein n=1 Tax=Natrinema versiforme TaxID=88724 RepID=A0A4P8WHU3_9EURY|nr:hypothetical protein [Natrinema versiforme]QCS42612.1 hypothetical protein FEJ81_09655 [Natrinema versiforme]